MEDERSHEAEVDGFLVLSRIAFHKGRAGGRDGESPLRGVKVKSWKEFGSFL